MSALAEPLHEAVEATLRASTALEAAMGTMRLYTIAPTNAPLPYIIFGDDTLNGDDTECADGAEAIVSLQVWAKPNPPEGVTCRQIADLVRDILNGPLDVDGHTVDEWEVESLSFSPNPDGSTLGRLTMRYLITELVA